MASSASGGSSKASAATKIDTVKPIPAMRGDADDVTGRDALGEAADAEADGEGDGPGDADELADDEADDDAEGDRRGRGVGEAVGAESRRRRWPGRRAGR